MRTFVNKIETRYNDATGPSTVFIFRLKSEVVQWSFTFLQIHSTVTRSELVSFFTARYVALGGHPANGTSRYGLRS